ncbi:hypothetical protein LQW54_012984 [Pestalotiopsis sp. IQ-011]
MSEQTSSTDQNVVLTEPNNRKHNCLRDCRLVIQEERGIDWPEGMTMAVLDLTGIPGPWKRRTVFLEQEAIFSYAINIEYKMDLSGHGRSLTEMRLPEMILATYLEGGGSVEDLGYIAFWEITDGPTRDSIDAVATHQQRKRRLAVPKITPLDSTWEAFASRNVLIQSLQELAETISGSEEKDVSVRKVLMVDVCLDPTFELGMMVELQHE